jgi:N-acyl-D-amino-acid deacylase
MMRDFGIFPRVLRIRVREEKLLTLEDAIRRFTSFPAQKLGLGIGGFFEKGCGRI